MTLKASTYKPSYGDIAGSNYSETSLCNADDNEFIPTACLRNGERVTYPDGTKKFLYSLKVPYYASGMYSKISIFKSRLRSEIDYYTMIHNRSWAHKFIGTTDTVVYMDEKTRGFVLLLALAVRKSQLFNISPSNCHPSQFSLIINNAFINDPEFFKLYRNLNKSYIPEMRETFDIVYTNDINRLMFNPIKLSLPKFNSMTDIVIHLKSMNQTVGKILSAV